MRDATARPHPRGCRCGESGSTLRFMLPVVCALGCGGQFLMAGAPARAAARASAQPARRSTAARIGPAGMAPLPAWGRMAGGAFDLPGNVSLAVRDRPAAGAAARWAEAGACGLHGAVGVAPLHRPDRGRHCARSGSRSPSRARPTAADGGERRALHGLHRWRPMRATASPGERRRCEGDWSNAAFWLCAGALRGRRRCACAGSTWRAARVTLPSSTSSVRLRGAACACHPGEGWADSVRVRPRDGGALQAARHRDRRRTTSPTSCRCSCVVAACAKGETRV